MCLDVCLQMWRELVVCNGRLQDVDCDHYCILFLGGDYQRWVRSCCLVQRCGVNADEKWEVAVCSGDCILKVCPEVILLFFVGFNAGGCVCTDEKKLYVLGVDGNCK